MLTDVERSEAMAAGKEKCGEKCGRWARVFWRWFRVQMKLQLSWWTWFARPLRSEVSQTEDQRLWRRVRQMKQMKLQLPWRTWFTRSLHLEDNQAEEKEHQAKDQTLLLRYVRRMKLQTPQFWSASAMCLEANEVEDHGMQRHSSLLHGLPDDIALLCLARLPLEFFRIARTVSKGWNDALQPKKIMALRRIAGLSMDIVFFFAKKNIAGSLHRFLLAIDPSLHTISEVPCPDCLLNHEILLEMIPGLCGEVLWLGRDKLLGSPLPQLFVLDYLCARWKRLPSMAKLNGGKFGLITVTIGRYAYFTGGWSSMDLDHVNKEVECLDLSNKQWSTIPHRHHLRMYGSGVVIGGHFVVFAGLPRSNPAERWHPETEEWQVFKDIWSKGVKLKRPYFTVVEGQLFAIWSKNTVATFDPLTNSWSQLGRITANATKICALLCVGDKLWAFLESDDEGSSMKNILLRIYVAYVGEVSARWEQLPLCIEVLQDSNCAISLTLAETR